MADYMYRAGYKDGYAAALKQADVKRGHWILKSEKIVDVEVKLPTECSNCDFSEFSAERYKFCPNCGAKMSTE